MSPYLHKDSIDPNLAVMRVDDGKGSPLATVWNFAIHGTCWGPEQLLSNGDIMGGTNEAIENLIGGVSLFINADAGDIAPCKKFTRAIGDVCVHARPCVCANMSCSVCCSSFSMCWEAQVCRCSCDSRCSTESPQWHQEL